MDRRTPGKDALLRKILESIEVESKSEAKENQTNTDTAAAAAAVLIALRTGVNGKHEILLTRRSHKVAQPGDYSFPGGHIDHLPDTLLAGILRTLPTGRNIYRTRQKSSYLLAAAAVREAWEEIRLNPFRLKLIGQLPLRELVNFRKAIHPVLAFTTQSDGFRCNDEVEELIFVQIDDLLNSNHYSALRVNLPGGPKETICFHPPGAPHFIWGATLFILLDFLYRAFDFTPPERENLPLVEYTLPEGYLPGE